MDAQRDFENPWTWGNPSILGTLVLCFIRGITHSYNTRTVAADRSISICFPSVLCLFAFMSFLGLLCLFKKYNNAFYLFSDAYAWTPRIFLLTSIPDAEDFSQAAFGSPCSASTQQPTGPGPLLHHQFHWGPPTRSLLSLSYQSN